MNRNSTLIVFGFLALVTVPLVIWGIISLSTQGTESVSLMVVPADASVKIEDQEYRNKDSIRLKPGIYKITVSKDGFESDTQELFIEEDNEATFISLLAPVSTEAQRWVKNNQKAYLEVEKEASALATQQGEEIIRRYPITKWLPLQKATYVIGYKQASTGSNKGIVVTISASEGYREAALQEIRDRGFDPSEYVIEFNEYRSPFNE